MFLNAECYPFSAQLSNSWQRIRSEYQTLDPRSLIYWPEKFLYDSAWTVFGFYALGRPLERNCSLCPETAAVLSGISGLINAGFSVLGPGTHIRPHVGYSDRVLRSHLGLVVPDQCGLRVGPQTYTWKEGEVVVFDDTVEHEAWNRNPSLERVVLLLDFQKAA